VTYLLDTNTCVYAIKRAPAVLERMRKLTPDELLVSTITLAELWFGARKSSRPEKTRESVDTFLAPLGVLDFDAAAADAYSGIRLHLEQAGIPIGERDLLIAAIAISRGLTVVTHNRREFSRVPDLDVEDWL
jgi:tRNA(fMet)-specific endonuclease VapC